MANSYVQYTGTGSQTVFSVPFPYIEKSHVKVYKNYAVVTNYSWSSSNVITFNNAPANGSVILIRRETPSTAMVDFTAKARWQTADLNLSSKQALYIAEEATDWASEWITAAGVPTNTIGIEGSFYLDTVAGTLYRKSAISWIALRSLIGPVGSQGPQGEKGEPGDTSVARKNFLWQGFFAVWQQGYAFSVETTQRRMICDGVTIARVGFADDVTIYNVNGTHRNDAVRIQRNNGNTSTAALTMVANLSQKESKAVVGKTVCLQFHAKKSATWSGSAIRVSLQYSEEPEQPIINDTGTYTNGNTVLETQLFTLNETTTSNGSPYFFSATIPSSATQVSVLVSVPWSGTADSADYVDIEGLFLTEGSTAGLVFEESFVDLLQKARTRYQSSYPYAAPRGVLTEQGAVSTIATSTASSWAFAIDVRFNPPMVIPPQFLFQSTVSGTESRLTDTSDGTTINGLAYNLSDKGVSITNNEAVTSGRRYLCHWTAQCLL